MKKLLRNMCADMLGICARAVIHKYKPRILMVTGSVGKTSTKDAIAAALSFTYEVRASQKSYNSEFGVPFTILGCENPWNSPLAWIRVYLRAFGMIVAQRPYPEILVLEVGADSPGDLKRILRIATPDIVVVTKLPEIPVHVEAYATPQAVREEEFTPAYALAPGKPLIISSDDTFASIMAKPLLAKVYTYGLAETADIHIKNPVIESKKSPEGEGNTITGMRAEVGIEGTTYTLYSRGSLGLPQLYSPAAALAVAHALGMSVEDALSGLKGYVPPPGRARILTGMNDSILIDDSYNSSPAAVEESLHTLSLVKELLPQSRMIAVLGDMLELGRYSNEEHIRIGKLVPLSAQVLVTVGKRAQGIKEGALTLDMKDIYTYESAEEAGEFLKQFIQKNDVVVIKGSQSMRMEKIVGMLLKHPKESNLLVRQDQQWKSK
jgi:UDP-N-acetylmuramoyl-tripeptide--D-alanyl-D-alanine ligase